MPHPSSRLIHSPLDHYKPHPESSTAYFLTTSKKIAFGRNPRQPPEVPTGSSHQPCLQRDLAVRSVLNLGPVFVGGYMSFQGTYTSVCGGVLVENWNLLRRLR